MRNGLRRDLLTCLFLMMAGPMASAQFGKKGGPELVWKHDIALSRAELRFAGNKVEGWSFVVHETSGKKLAHIWRTDHALISRSITTRDPMVANNAMIPAISPLPVIVLARVKDEKPWKQSILSIALLGPDSLPLQDEDAVQRHVRSLAVKYNKAVVESQIRAHEAEMARGEGRLSKSERTGDKQQKDLNKMKADLQKVQAARLKEQARNARYQGDLVGAEQKYTLTNDPRDLKRLSSSRNKLSAGEGRVAKLMDRESKLTVSTSKLEGGLAGTARGSEQHRSSLSEQQKVLDALRVKLLAIQ
jgi:hypothetical protein